MLMLTVARIAFLITMVELELEPQTTATRPRARGCLVLGLLATAQVAFAAGFTPMGTRSGQWSVGWLPDPDFLPFVASGATIIYPLLLYPLWVGLGCGDRLRRYATTLVVCLAFVSAVTVRGLCRHPPSPWVRDTVLLREFVSLMSILLLFSLLCLVFLLVRRFWGWRIGLPGDSPSLCGRSRRVQFRLRHLFECVAIAACMLAAYRYYFPHGVPDELITNGRQKIEILCRAVPVVILVLLPTTLIPWTILAFPGRGKSILYALGATIGWIGLDCALVRFGGMLKPVILPEVIAIQLGASASALISALVLRTCGYRLFRIQIES